MTLSVNAFLEKCLKVTARSGRKIKIGKKKKEGKINK
jgi:hypothetical protein